jgi:ABC-2 type transport system permease protein
MFNGHIWKVFSYELLRNARRRGYLFATFGLPVLGILIGLFIQFIASQSQPESPEEAAELLQFDFGSIETAAYVDPAGVFSGVNGADDLIAYPDVASAEAALEAGEVDTVYVISEDFTETGDVRQIVPQIALDAISTQPVQKLMFDLLDDDLSPALLARLQYPTAINVVNLQRAPTDEDAVSSEDSNFALVYGFAILFLLTVFGTSGYLMQSVIEEKENRLVEILISSVRPLELLVGKVLALGLLGLAQIVSWLAIGFLYLSLQNSTTGTNFLSGIRVPLDALPILVAYFVLGYLMFAAAFGAVGAISNSISEGPQFSIVFSVPIILTFYVFPAFINDPNSTLPTLLSLFPLTSPLAMVMRSVVAPVPAWQVILSLALLVLAVLGMFWMAGRVFRVQTLLSGSVPKLREIPKLIFGN